MLVDVNSVYIYTIMCAVSFLSSMGWLLPSNGNTTPPEGGWGGGMCQKGRQDKAGVVSIRANNYIGDGITLFRPVKCFFIWCGADLWNSSSFFLRLPHQTFLFCFCFGGRGGGVIDFWISPSGLWVWSVAKRHHRGRKMCVRLIFSPIRQWSEKYPAVFDERVKRIAILQAFMELPIFCFFFWNA